MARLATESEVNAHLLRQKIRDVEGKLRVAEYDLEANYAEASRLARQAKTLGEAINKRNGELRELRKQLEEMSK